MVLLDDDRRYVDVNLALLLVFRLRLDQIRGCTIDDLVAPERVPIVEQVWRRLMSTGSVAGRGVVSPPDGNRFETVYCVVANVMPGRHVGASAPATWSETEFGELPSKRPAPPSAPLTARELEVLQLAAEGRSGPDIARALVLSPLTVGTHFGNIYAKLGVSDRAAAVARAMRLGVIV
jgi:DNA-binding CsgD family transcriptional regulator